MIVACAILGTAVTAFLVGWASGYREALREAQEASTGAEIDPVIAERLQWALWEAENVTKLYDQDADE